MRVRIGKNGIDIARPGYSVLTATPAQMVFSSAAVAARLAYSGTVAVGAFDSLYYKGEVVFPAAFPQPPIVFVAGLKDGAGFSQQGPFFTIGATVNSGTGYVLPHYEIRTYVDRFELYVLHHFPSGAVQGSGVTTWNYFVLANTLST